MHTIPLAAVVFQGKQASEFLQGMATNQIQFLSITKCVPSLFCQYQGKIFSSGYLYRQSEDCIWLLTDPFQAKQAQEKLHRYGLLSKIKISIIYLDAKGLISSSSATKEQLYQVRTASLKTTITISPHCMIAFSTENTKQLVPKYTDLVLNEWHSALMMDKTPLLSSPILNRLTPNQIGLVPSDWVSLNKGCYCGQEIIARSYHLGKLHRKIITLKTSLLDAVPQPGHSLMLTNPKAKLVVLAVCQRENYYQIQAAGPRLDISPSQKLTISHTSTHLQTVSATVLTH